MKPIALMLAAAVIAAPFAAAAQTAVMALDAAGQQAAQRSSDPKLAAQKKMVYDMWRSFIDARHVEMAPQFFTERYIQHNPNVPDGRAPAVAFFSQRPATPIQPTMSNLVALVAEGDLVTVATRRELADPKDAYKKYTSTWFDMYRFKDGKIDEHWDFGTKAP